MRLRQSNVPTERKIDAFFFSIDEIFLTEHLKILDLHKIWKYYNRKSNVPTERKFYTFIFFYR